MDDARRCIAHSSRTGRPCRKAAIAGGTVCATHGGRAPQVQASAAQRLLEAADPAAARLVKLLKAEDDRTVLRACIAILDRAGLGPGSTVELGGRVDGGPLRIERIVTDVDLSKLSTETLRRVRAELDGEPAPVPEPKPATFRTMPARPAANPQLRANLREGAAASLRANLPEASDEEEELIL